MFRDNSADMSSSLASSIRDFNIITWKHNSQFDIAGVTQIVANYFDINDFFLKFQMFSNSGKLTYNSWSRTH